MDREIAGLIRTAEEEGALPEEKAEIVRVLLRQAADYQGPEYARILLVAIQRHVIPWIPELGGETRAEILAWYQQKYPRRKRFPVQERIIAALKAGTSRR